MTFPQNIGMHLSIDETSLSNGELYTIITNKEGKGKKGSLLAMVEGTKVEEISPILGKLSEDQRSSVSEVTLDMAPHMARIIRESFPHATQVLDRFHVQQLVTEALQEIRIELRREALKAENEGIKKAKEEGGQYSPFVFSNGDTEKQMLARSRYLLFKPESKWHENQRVRAKILFREYPALRKGYALSMMFRNCYEASTTKKEASASLEKWYTKVEEKEIDQFTCAAESIRNHEEGILNYFPNRSTNAGAESFNAKLKGFRSVVRGVRDKKFHLYRVAMLYGGIEEIG